MNTIIEKNIIPTSNNTSIETLNDLIYALHQVFESNSVNIDYVSYLMKSYKSNSVDWKKFAKFDRYRYTRNLVDEGNGKFNLMLLCWGEGHGSAIHDHANAHCFMKVLQGELEEVRFSWPEKVLENDNTDINDESSALQEISRSRLELNNVCYINDTMGLHRVENPSHSNVAISLHLYCPPFDACHIFNQQTGKKTVSQVTFWSKFGSRRNRDIQANREPEDN
ncbi:cysteine dioxygenase type 1 [Chrysoperla carnea]|uniref:cysteine dioxygenase type 1 n=1 Tax=Chrysoperla carnea TaxID=189513 RepID=UPI001D06664E|nr:cysteine dioxygenase type 1 [Chrysoperla carnea]